MMSRAWRRNVMRLLWPPSDIVYALVTALISVLTTALTTKVRARVEALWRNTTYKLWMEGLDGHRPYFLSFFIIIILLNEKDSRLGSPPLILNHSSSGPVQSSPSYLPPINQKRCLEVVDCVVEGPVVLVIEAGGSDKIRQDGHRNRRRGASQQL